MAKEIITIKDIAARAGVSTGTVDRVLHNRPNVSKKALEKVNKALDELDYRPNMYERWPVPSSAGISASS